MPRILKVGVVGVDHLGKWHAEKYTDCADCELIAVVDSNLEVAREVATKHGATANSGYREILSLVDAIGLVVPTSLYYKIAREFLEAGIHCLIEKPITEAATQRCLPFPIFPEMSFSQVDSVCGTMPGA